MMIKKFLLLIIVCFLSCNEKGGETNDQKIKKLESLNEYCSKYSLTEKGEALAYKLRNEALKQKNDKYIGLSYYYIGMNLSSSYPKYLANKDSTQYYFLLAKQYSKKAGDKKTEMMSDYQRADTYWWEGELVLAMNLIKPLLKSAEDINDPVMIIRVNKLLSKIYLLLNNPDEAYLRAEEGYKVLKNTPSDDTYNQDLLEIVFAKAASLYYKKEYKKSLSYCDTVQGYLKKDFLESEMQRLSYPYALNELRTINLIELERLPEAEVLIKQLKVYQEKYPMFKDSNLTNWNYLNAKYYFKLRNYPETLKYLDPQLSYGQISKMNITERISIYQLKADTYAAENKYEAAMSVKEKLSQYLDSINKINYIDEINDLKNVQNIEKLIIENQNNQQKIYYTTYVIILLSSICLLSILTFYIINRSSKKLKVKNRQIFGQYKNLDKYTVYLNNIDQAPATQRTDSMDQILFDKAEAYLKSSRLFLNPEVTREVLALELGTNREYLIRTIQKHTGKTFKEYINDKRLEYSRQLLSYSTELSIDDIYIVCGFKSKRSYFRLFENKYDITPKELRDIAISSDVEVEEI